MKHRLSLLLVGLFMIACAARAAGAPVDYLRDVNPILKAHCFDCHGSDEQESGLRLDTAKAAIEGGNSGPVIVPGNSGESLLIKAVLGLGDVERMPPEDEADKLSDVAIDVLKRWIDQGAKYPPGEEPAAATSPEDLPWSFRPVVRHRPPHVAGETWGHNAIDAFVLARLHEQGIKPSPRADRQTLIRRVSLDLIGLPPTPEQVEAFVNDERPDAYERLVDRLLTSPYYGERWGRHWLDQARYADSDGYTNDVPRVMWRYRDWVIDAVNRDLAFDRFTIEQIAGDMLADATQDQIVASGFHRNTQHNREGGSDPEQYRVEAVVDRVSTTGVVFLGLTLGCARCHEHKFDPIEQKEFYQIFAFLNNQDEPTFNVTLDPDAQAQLKAAGQQRAAAEKRLKEHEAAGESSSPESDKSSDTTREELMAKIAELKQQEQALAKRAATTTLVMRQRSELRETYIHLRGDFLRKGQRVVAGVPASLPPIPDGVESPNRLDFARWLVSPDNPLTPRVTMNRVWQRLFSKGIVETQNDFGGQGTPPSHPKLLDWLASEFVDGGWSRKAMLRLIVTSATYRQSSHARPDLATVDPDNNLLARQTRRRLEAEIVRDTALAGSGLLSQKMKGPSVFPPQPAGVQKMTRNPGRKWIVSKGGDRYRRGMYTYFWRTAPYPFLKLFNAPEANATCTRRERSNTPLQALTLLNDEAFIEAAQALAVRLISELPAAGPTARIERAFRLCLARRPSAPEIEALLELLHAELDDPAGSDEQTKFAAAAELPADVDMTTLSAWTSVARALLNSDEFITRE